MKKAFLITLILMISLMPLNVMAEEAYRTFIADRLGLNLGVQYFTSSSNYNKNGDKQSLAAGASLTSISLATSVRYVLATDFGLYSGLNFNNVETNNGTLTRTNSNLTNVFLGTDYRFYNSSTMQIYSDISFKIKTENIDPNGDSAIASDGANELLAQAYVVFKGDSLRSYIKAGYNYRTEGLSSLALYGAGAELQFSSSSLGLALDGFSTVKDDENTDNSTVRDNVTFKVNAGSRRYYAVNPNLLEVQVYYAYTFTSDLSLKINAGSTLSGSNSAEGYRAGISLDWVFGGRTHAARRIKKSNTVNNTSMPDTEPGFKIETEDGVDQNLFKSTDPTPQKK